VEIVSRGGAVYNLHVDLFEEILVVVVLAVSWNSVVLVAKLEVSLNSTG